MFLVFDLRTALKRKPKQGATLSFNKQVHFINRNTFLWILWI